MCTEVKNKQKETAVSEVRAAAAFGEGGAVGNWEGASTGLLGSWQCFISDLDAGYMDVSVTSMY